MKIVKKRHFAIEKSEGMQYNVTKKTERYRYVVEENIDKCFDNISGSAAAKRRNHLPHLRDVGNVAVFCNVVGFGLRFRRNTFGVLGHWKNERYALYRFGRCLDGIYNVLYLCDSGIRRYLFRFPF